MDGLDYRKQNLIVLLIVLFLLAAGSALAVSSTEVKAIFTDPPREYSTSPLWVWNDMLTEEQIASTLLDMANQKVRQVFVHPRPGLMTPYMTKDWMQLWKVALAQAEKLDMNIWIYDENSYPSGFAGGLVPDAMPQSRGKGLFMREEKKPPKWSNDMVAVYRLSGNRYENVTEAVKSGRDMTESKYIIAFTTESKISPWYGGKFYVDLIKPGVTEKFLEVTMEPYRREFGDQFGKRVPGVFTDEPRMNPGGGHPWTDDLDTVFEKRWGYKLMDHLPALFMGVGDFKRVRFNYFQTLLELAIDRWARPYYEYCEKFGLEFTGHYWEHGWPNCEKVPDNMAMYAWQQRPGIDTLMNKYDEGKAGQFGNVRAVKELSSVANQMGRKRTLCEAYGAGGWDLRFEDMKRIGDWLYVLGVNFLDEHLSYITIRGARKRDHPQSFSYHEPWWSEYHVMAQYFTRLSAALSQGQQINRILLIEPTTTAWMYQLDPEHKGHLNKIGDEFQKLVVDLAKAQVEFDIGCEDIMARHGSVQGRKLRIGQREYETIVLPPLMENVNSKTMDLLRNYEKNGGDLICCDTSLALIDAVMFGFDIPYKKSDDRGWNLVDKENLTTLLLNKSKDGFAIRRSDNENGILFHHRRTLDDGELLFVTNSNIDSSASGIISSGAKSAEKWDLETAKVSAYPFKSAEDGMEAQFDLAPCGSLLLFLSNRFVEPVTEPKAESTKLEPTGPMKITRPWSNVLTLDYVDLTVGGETCNDIYFYNASKLIFQKHGLDANPWDSAVQFKDELITKTFADDSGFDATYKFTIEEKIPGSINIVIERPDLYEITCNAKLVSAEQGKSWLDKSFGMIDIKSTAKLGANRVTIKASPMTIYHELEPAYIVGNFALKEADKGFVIVPDKPLELGPWNRQGNPFYAKRVTYAQEFDIPEVKGKYAVSLPKWYGSVAMVFVNNHAGYIFHQPWECDVTEWIKTGKNTVEVVVIGTLRNTLGPHHGNNELGSTWPGMFRKAPQTGPPPGADYQTIDYGLFEPFELQNRKKQ